MDSTKAANSHAGGQVVLYSYETKIKWVDKAEAYIRRGTSLMLVVVAIVVL